MEVFEHVERIFKSALTASLVDAKEVERILTQCQLELDRVVHDCAMFGGAKSANRIRDDISKLSQKLNDGKDKN